MIPKDTRDEKSTGEPDIESLTVRAPGPRGPYRVRTTITRLAFVREQALLTQLQLALLAGVSERSVRKHESLVHPGDVWQATQKRLIGVCIQEIERQHMAFSLTTP